MIKLGFIVPIISKEYSSDWTRHIRLLNMTVQSILNQEDSSFCCYVVTKNSSDLQVGKALNLRIIDYPYERLAVTDLTGYGAPQLKNIDHIERNYDIGKKSLYGANQAIQDGCTHIMKVDADDLVSNRLVSFLQKGNHKTNYYIPNGYVMTLGSKFLYQEDSLNDINGSTNIVASRYLPAVDFSSRNINDFNFFTSHSYLKVRVEKLSGSDVIPIPFRVLIYVKHPSGVSQSHNLYDPKTFKGLFKLIMRGKRLTARIRQEFSIPLQPS